MEHFTKLYLASLHQRLDESVIIGMLFTKNPIDFCYISKIPCSSTDLLKQKILRTCEKGSVKSHLDKSDQSMSSWILE